jgi:hypothetical protein
MSTAPAKRTSRQQEARAAAAAIPGGIGGDPHAEVITITPDLADSWLSRNTHNRPIRQARVDELANAIRRGEWRLNGDAIRFDTGGTLLDGQHRLWAIFLADQPVEALVITNLDPEAQVTMDTGARRNLKDALALRGEGQGLRLSAAINYIYRIKSGSVRLVTSKPTIAQGLALFDSDPDGIRDAARTADRVRMRFRISGAMIAGVYYQLAEVDQDGADVFVEKLVNGAGLDEGDPIFVLRRYMERQAVAGAGAKASTVVTHALIVKAWNAWREGRHIENLTWKASGSNAEDFPVPK